MVDFVLWVGSKIAGFTSAHPRWTLLIIFVLAAGKVAGDRQRENRKLRALEGIARGVSSVPLNVALPVCPRCGTTAHLPSALFCGKCGASLSGAKTALPPTSAGFRAKPK
jgi:hypothetical protein